MRKAVVAVLVLGMGTLAGALPASAGGGCHAETATEGAGTTVEMKDACFGPMVLHVEPGATVTWTNQDEIAHVVGGTGWGTYADVAPGSSVAYRFDQPGVYAYSCFYHPGMNGVVLAGDVSRSATALGAVANVPPTTPPPAEREVPTAAASNDSVEPAVSTGVPAGWRVASIVGFGLFLLAAGVLVLERIGRRRAVAEVQPG